MLDDLSNSNLTNFNKDLDQIIVHMLVALVCGIIISLVYRYTYKGPSYSTSFTNSLVLLSMITSIVIMVIGNNTATAFGLVGAMSIIRFRTAVRDVIDIVFIFFSLAIGLAAGVGFKEIAIAGTAIISVVIILVVKTNFAKPKRRNYLLQVLSYNDEETEDGIQKQLRKYCKQLKLVNLQTHEHDNNIEAYYHVVLRKQDQSAELLRELKEISKVEKINLYFDEEDSPQ
ncbi:MAG: DUF4956 domain-containing protein [Flavobacteriales bacterium]|nr:DUF4956 domain-containing protein [Flavobacteriales bacterium]